jgi:hypothetical protein
LEVIDTAADSTHYLLPLPVPRGQIALKASFYAMCEHSGDQVGNILRIILDFPCCGIELAVEVRSVQHEKP